jgi:hypothetical protein
VHVFNAVDQESNREPSFLNRFVFVLHDLPELVDLVDDAAVLRVIGRPFSIVLGFVEENVHVMPGGGVPHPAANLVCPRRGVGDRLAWLQ